VGCWDKVDAREYWDFSSLGTLTQSRLLLARIILGDFETLFRIFWKKRQVKDNSISCLEQWSRMAMLANCLLRY